MPTHQSLGGASDAELLQRMIETYPDRFGEDFWAIFDARVAPLLPARPTMIDLGCGPGLLLRDLATRYLPATVYGYDVTPAMVEHARSLPYSGAKATLAVHDVATKPLPNATGSAHLIVMSSVLHVLDEPLPVLAEIRRVLAPGGVFLLIDWIRQPLPAYLAWRREIMGDDSADGQRRAFRLFPAHNKYTTEDWRWLLAESGLAVRHETQSRPSHRIFVTVPAGPAVPAAASA